MMEFLNNIWIAVSTPNEKLIKLFSPLVFIEIPLSFYLISSVLNLNVTRKNKWLYIVSTVIVSLISLFFFIYNYSFYFKNKYFKDNCCCCASQYCLYNCTKLNI